MKDLIKPMKWYFLDVAVLLAWLAYANLNGERILSFGNQENWTSGGSRTHSGIMHHK